MQGSLTYLNHDKDAKPQSGTFSIIQSPTLGLKEKDVSQTHDHIHIMVGTLNSNQDPIRSQGTLKLYTPSKLIYKAKFWNKAMII